MTQTIPQDVSVLPIVRQAADEIIAGASSEIGAVAFRMWLAIEHPGVDVANSGPVLVAGAEKSWQTVGAYRQTVIDQYRDLAAQAVELATSSVVA